MKVRGRRGEMLIWVLIKLKWKVREGRGEGTFFLYPSMHVLLKVEPCICIF